MYIVKYYINIFGVVAQQGERRLGMAKVAGSNPADSIKKEKHGNKSKIQRKRNQIKNK